MRDLAKEHPRNGRDLVEPGDPPPDVLADEDLTAAQLAQARREVRRDRSLASIATMMIDTARYVDPLIEMLSAKLLRWAALAAEITMTVIALREPSLDRLEVLGVFTVFALFVLRKA